MKYILKKHDGQEVPTTRDALAIRYENGTVRWDSPVRPEDATEWTSVGALLGVEQVASCDEVQSPTSSTAPCLESDAMSWLDGQYANMSWFGVVLCIVTTIGLPVGLVGVVGCRHPAARMKALIIFGLQVALLTVGFIVRAVLSSSR